MYTQLTSYTINLDLNSWPCQSV